MNSEHPLVSAIVIFFNEECFLQEAIQSVADQSYENWELILVDDGSTDMSPEIAKSFARQHPDRVQFISHPKRSNRGMSASRNLGLEHASGDYVSFLDGDDVWFPQKLAQQVRILQSHPECVLASGGAEIWRSWTGEPEDSGLDLFELDYGGIPLDAPVAPPSLLTTFLQNETASPNCALMRLESVRKVGGYEDDFRGMYEDQILNAKLCLESPVFVSSQCWFRYRRHENSCVVRANESGTKCLDRKRFLDWLARYLSQREMESTEVWEIMQNEMTATHTQGFLIEP